MLSKRLLFPGILLLILLIIAVDSLNHYFQWNSLFFALSVIALCCTWQAEQTSKVSWRCAIVAIVFWGVYRLIPVFTLCYLGLLFTAAFIVELCYRRIAALTFITAFLIAPVIDYIANVFTFPIRLWLSQFVGSGIALMNTNVGVAGNVIMINKQEFSVDTACMGLSMMITSLLFGVVLIAIFQKKMAKKLSLLQLILILISIAILNIGSNVFRIAILVLLRIPPSNSMHEVIGIITLVIYVLLPAVFGIKWMLKRFGKNNSETLPFKNPKLSGILAGATLVTLAITVVYVLPKNEVKTAVNIVQLPGTTVTTLNDQICRQASTDLLLYIKPIPSFYFSDHQPMICWKGSGFEFYKVTEVKIDGKKIFQAVLKKADATLYTAWWYESKNSYSNSQLSWRWDALRNGTSYYLMNVTTNDPHKLTESIRQVMNAHLIR
ncbi:exosortase N [Chitinophaga silvatica]|uniref:Exosortase N n=1 Tax=Chitinophaga silvatica TaxID=2282649 RepID=A0A3E1YG99_9BACT|nr:exosortase N [Chitinophaga silvatica]RFS26404.1 exosortase N [Chitinophaga silvatica]